MEKIIELLLKAETNFPKEFKRILPCLKTDKHEWSIDSSIKEKDFRFIDIKCKKCGKNLAVVLRLFAGIQDHG